MGYFTWKEDEAYRDGYNDGRYGRRDYFRDKHSGNDEDKAYYEGLREAEREEERRREMYEQERQQEEQEYYKQMEQEQYPEPPQQNQDDDLPW